jgi:phage tail protein X
MEFSTYITEDKKIAFKDGNLQELAANSRKWSIVYNDDITDTPNVTAKFEVGTFVDIIIYKEYGKTGSIETITILNATPHGMVDVGIEEAIACAKKYNL